MVKKQKQKQVRGRGRPPTNWTGMHLTLLPHTVEALDKWIVRQPDEHLTRQEAIRRLLDQALGAGKSTKQTKGGK